MKKSLTVIAVIVAAALVLASCASAPAKPAPRASGSAGSAPVKADSFLGQARQYEKGGNHTGALAAYSVAQATGQLTDEQLKAEFARIKGALGADRFRDAALQAADFCNKAAETANKEAEQTKDQQKTLEALVWIMAALNLTVAVE